MLFLLAVSVSGAGAQPSAQVRAQAAEVKAHALDHIERVRPQWSAETWDSWAESFEKAVLSQAEAPLTAQQLADIKKAAARAAQTSYSRPLRAQHEFSAAVWEWMVGDIISTPPPDPADVERLKDQVRELARYAGEQVAEHFGISAELAMAATKEGEAVYLGRIDEPKYRFDRKPMTEEQMQAARTDIARRLAEDAQSHPWDVTHAPPWEGPDGKPDRLLSRFVLLALGRVSYDHWSWRHSPDNPRFRVVRQRAREGHETFFRARELARRVVPHADLLALAGIDPDPIGGWAAMLPVGDLPAGEADIVRTLRGALGYVGRVRYAAHVGLTRAPPDQTKRLDATCVVEPGLLRLELTAAADRLATQPDRLAGFGVVCEITSEQARVLSPNGQEISILVHDPLGDTPEHRGAVPSRWEAPQPSTDVLALAQIADPGRFQWHKLPRVSTAEGTSVFEAQMKQPVTISELGEVASLRYEFDPARRVVVRLTACDGDGRTLWETVYGAFERLPDGSAVALAATRRLGPGVPARSHWARIAPPSQLHWLGAETLTRYRWLPEHGVRVPRSRDIRDTQGHQECLVLFDEPEVEDGT